MIVKGETGKRAGGRRSRNGKLPLSFAVMHLQQHTIASRDPQPSPSAELSIVASVSAPGVAESTCSLNLEQAREVHRGLQHAIATAEALAGVGPFGAADPRRRLTPAQLRVLSEILKGKASRQIAASFDRSTNTINNHTRAIFTAFGVHSRSRLIAIAAEAGIIAEDR
jgi:DNA-binding NarL/FixJ family response regulator